MSQIAAILKAEITRLSKKTTKTDLSALRSAVVAQKRSTAMLKRQITALQRDLKALSKSKRGAGVSTSSSESEEGTAHRFQVRGLKSLRARLGLSATDLGRLIGASGQSIYNWETGKATPRKKQIAALATVRGLGKREAQKKLAETGGK